MGWFARKSAPAFLGPIPAMLERQVEAFPRSYQERLAEVYVRNPVGQRAVRLVAGATASLPIYVKKGRSRAGALITRPELLENVTAHLLLHGNAYLQTVSGARGLVELFPLSPERVSVVANGRGWPSAYVYRAGGKTLRIDARDALARRQIIHLKALNPGGDQLGLGCLDAAIAAASVHNRATRWNKALLDNSARPSGALLYEPGDGSNLTTDQLGRLRDELDRQFSGSDNAGRPMLLEGGLKWQAMSLSPAEMDFIALREAAARVVALAFGVPPALLGLPGDSTYANLREAGRALYRQTVLPLAKRILDGVADVVSDWLGDVELAVDVDQISELAEDRERLWSQVEAANFLSRAEKRDLLGFGKGELE